MKYFYGEVVPEDSDSEVVGSEVSGCEVGSDGVCEGVEGVDSEGVEGSVGVEGVDPGVLSEGVGVEEAGSDVDVVEEVVDSVEDAVFSESVSTASTLLPPLPSFR